MSEWFEVGMKVRCRMTRAWLYEPDANETYPVDGGVYTVRTIERSPYDGLAYLRFVEIRNPKTRRHKDGTAAEPQFFAGNFRPLRKRKTSIEVFQRLLKTEKVEVKA